MTVGLRGANDTEERVRVHEEIYKRPPPPRGREAYFLLNGGQGQDYHDGTRVIANKSNYNDGRTVPERTSREDGRSNAASGG